MQRPIHSITPFTLLDFPDRVACILWFAGCNMRCVYCYNPEIVLGKGKVSIPETEAFLRSRQGLLQGVVFGGGECTSHKSMPTLVETSKQMGYSTKVDTNGSQPRVLEELLGRGVLDYVALDFKALPHRYLDITKSALFAQFEESFLLLMASGIPFEVRTTVHSTLISMDDLAAMTGYLRDKGYTGNYYLQYAVNDVPTLEPLPRSSRLNQPEALSTENLRISIRN